MLRLTQLTLQVTIEYSATQCHQHRCDTGDSTTLTPSVYMSISFDMTFFKFLHKSVWTKQAHFTQTDTVSASDHLFIDECVTEKENSMQAAGQAVSV